MRPPTDMHDRQREWEALASFAAHTGSGATMGVVSGRRRQGKSFLLSALCESADGFYYEAIEGTERDQLRHLGAELSAYLGAPARLAMDDWAAAIDTLLRLGADAERPLPVVLDEFPHLVTASPSLPSVVRRALGPKREERRDSRTRLILCGSSIAMMGRLLAGTGELRGRAGLELVVPPFDFRQAAEFWSISDHELAVRTYAVIGGTPAYAREFVRGDVPSDPTDYDAWICRAVLDPSMPLFYEMRYLLSEDPTMEKTRDLGAYHSILAAIASGERTHGGIATYLGRRGEDITHLLRVLEDAGFVEHREDALRSRRPTYHLIDPFARFHHAVMRPRAADLQRPGAARAVWNHAAATFSSQVLGPTFEEICREWVRTFASETTLSGRPSRVASTVINDRSRRRQLELDLVALGDGSRCLAVGEAKWGRTLGTDDLARLERARELREELTGAKLVLCSAAGFSPALGDLARGRSDVELVDLARLFAGS